MVLFCPKFLQRNAAFGKNYLEALVEMLKKW